jgi:hypothetical protein
MGAEGIDEVISRPKSVGRKACLALGPTGKCASPDIFSDGSNLIYLKLPKLKARARPKCL